MEYLQNLLTVVWALRVVIAFVAFMVLVALWLDARHDRDEARAEARGLIFENLELRAAMGERHRQISARRKKPIIAGRVVS
jgi:hypothetical protein